jgi:hypothetical protein
MKGICKVTNYVYCLIEVAYVDIVKVSSSQKPADTKVVALSKKDRNVRCTDCRASLLQAPHAVRALDRARGALAGA